MKISISNSVARKAVSRIYLDGVMQTRCLMADDKKGVIERYAVDDNGDVIINGDELLTEIVKGEVCIEFDNSISSINFAFGSYERCGDISCFRIFGFTVWQSVGEYKSLFGVVWASS